MALFILYSAKKFARTEQTAAHGDLLESNPFVTTSKIAVKSPRAPSDGVDSAKNQHGADGHKAGS